MYSHATPQLRESSSTTSAVASSPSTNVGESNSWRLDEMARSSEEVLIADNTTDTAFGWAAGAEWAQPQPGAIHDSDHPEYLLPGVNMDYASMAKSGRAERTPWSGDYWAKNKGGIAHRWQTGERAGDSPDLESLRQMSPEGIALLSPAEKYDLFVGDYRYPLTDSMKISNTEGTASWQGYCHGWAQAAIHFPEPRPVVMTNPDGIQVPFSSSDIKALLTWHQGEAVTSRASQEQFPENSPQRSMGFNHSGRDPRDTGSYDVNPGAFHAVMAQKLGEEGQAFGIDMDSSTEKWNQPAYAFESRERLRRAPDRHASSDAVEEVVVETDLTYTLEIAPQHESTEDKGNHHARTDRYLYSIELDADGQIVGGQWLVELEGQLFTYHDVVEILEQQGRSNDEIVAIMPQLFTYPDYVYLQDKGEFAQEFRPAQGPYEFMSIPKQKMHGYLSRLQEIVESASQ